MPPTTPPATPDHVRSVDLRRAVLGHLLRAGGPVLLHELVEQLAADFPDGIGDNRLTPKRIADVLRYQVRLGRVRRVGRGVYEAVPGAMSRSTAWRCLNWRRERQRVLGGGGGAGT